MIILQSEHNTSTRKHPESCHVIITSCCLATRLIKPLGSLKTPRKDYNETGTSSPTNAQFLNVKLRGEHFHLDVLQLVFLLPRERFSNIVQVDF